MRISLSILFFLAHIVLNGQTYSFQQVKDSSYSILESQIGAELAQYFELPHNNLSISYLNWRGKSSTKWIGPGEMLSTKRLKEVSLLLEFKHPDVAPTDITVRYFMCFNGNLALQDTFDLHSIPNFIREGRPNDWLSPQERKEIMDTLIFEKKVQRMLTAITYDKPSRNYYFEVRSIYQSKDGYNYYENYWINIVSGRIEEHFYSKLYVCSTI